MKSPGHAIAPLILCVLLAACSRGDAEHAPGNSILPAASAKAPDTPVAMRELPDFSALVERYGDAVVNVRVVGTTAASDSSDDPLSQFFRRFGKPGPDTPNPRGQLMQGSGSGFVVSPDGYILTNAHVVQQADEITVKLTDRREFPAKVIGSDARTDVAVIKIDAANLPVVKIGDDKQLKTGQWVLAIGAPFGLENTATAGIVSGTSRAVGGESSVPFIQTDVAVNPGNSGGPLFNLNGEVVGINSMIFSQSGGYMGISFAVPIDVAMEVREQLVKTGHVERGRIGVVVQNLDASLAKSFKLDRPRGALVSAVEKGGPADKAGIKPGDVILKVGNEKIEESYQVSNAVAHAKPGTDTEFSVWRGGSEKDITVKVAKLEEQDARNAGGKPARDEAEGTKLGLVVRPLTPEEKQGADTEGSVVVADVQGSAERAGIQPGDIILAVNDQAVKNVQDLRTAASHLRPGDAAALLVERGGTQIFVPVRAG